MDWSISEFSERRLRSSQSDQLTTQRNRNLTVNRPRTCILVSHQKECGTGGGVRLARGYNTTFVIQDEQCLQLELWCERRQSNSAYGYGQRSTIEQYMARGTLTTERVR